MIRILGYGKPEEMKILRKLLTEISIQQNLADYQLDTFVVLGSLGGQLDVEPKRWFALGTISASFLWFFGLALLAAWLAPRLRTAKAQRIINLVVGCVMWFIALQLARDGIAHSQALFS